VPSDTIKVVTAYDAAGNRTSVTRFYTQQDPIGLAGGLNLYGFAAGDPVNFSDPFGLCPPCAAAYEVFEVASSAYDLFDLARTAISYSRGRTSRAELGVTAAGAGLGLVAFGGGYGRAAREVVDRAVAAGARNVAEQLAFSELLPGVARGSGVVMAGGTSKVAFRNAGRVAEAYGGNAADWVKKTTTASVTTSSGNIYQLHWVENIRTGQIVDTKLTRQAAR